MNAKILKAGFISLAFCGALVACDNMPGSAKKTGTDGKPAAGPAVQVKGLDSEKEQFGYVIGRDMAESLKPAKDDIDMNALVKGLKAGFAGEKSLLTDEQASTVRESLGQKVQARQIAEMMAASKKNAAEGQKFLAENGKKPGVITTPSGLQYQVLTEGTGAKLKPTDIVQLNYKGMLVDGKVFDSSEEHGGPAAFQPTAVVPGLREAMGLMRVGGKYKVFIPASLAYGEQGTPGGPIPPNATLLFDIEVVGTGPIQRQDAPAAQ